MCIHSIRFWANIDIRECRDIRICVGSLLCFVHIYKIYKKIYLVLTNSSRKCIQTSPNDCAAAFIFSNMQPRRCHIIHVSPFRPPIEFGDHTRSLSHSFLYFSIDESIVSPTHSMEHSSSSFKLVPRPPFTRNSVFFSFLLNFLKDWATRLIQPHKSIISA